MRDSIYKFTLDIHDARPQYQCRVKKGETARKLQISFTENGKQFTIASGTTAVYMQKKPGGTVLYNDCDVDLRNNRVVYQFTEQTVSAEGLNECEIRLYDEDARILCSPAFTLIVSETVYQDGQVESSSEYTALTSMVSQGTTIVNTTEGYKNQALNARNQAYIYAYGDADNDVNGALQYKNQAETARNTAVTMAGTASQKAETATEKASAAETSESNALAYKVEANTAKENAYKYAHGNGSELGAEQYKTLAQSAKEDAEKAKTDAVTARDFALSYRDTAEGYKNTALDAMNGALTAKEKAEKAKDQTLDALGGANRARSGAEAAQEAAEKAQELAEIAQNASESAKSDAISAKEEAEEAAIQASSSAQSVSESEEDIIALKNDACDVSDIGEEKTYNFRTATSYPLGFRNGYFSPSGGGKSVVHASYSRTIYPVAHLYKKTNVIITPKTGVNVGYCVFSSIPNFGTNADNSRIFLRGSATTSSKFTLTLNPGEYLYIYMPKEFAKLTYSDLPTVTYRSNIDDLLESFNDCKLLNGIVDVDWVHQMYVTVKGNPATGIDIKYSSVDSSRYGVVMVSSGEKYRIVSDYNSSISLKYIFTDDNDGLISYKHAGDDGDCGIVVTDVTVPDNATKMYINSKTGIGGVLTRSYNATHKQEYIDCRNANRAIHIAKWFTGVKWSPTNTGMPRSISSWGTQGKFFTKGTVYTGANYSSAKKYGKYVGVHVLPYTWLTAIHNPMSQMYQYVPVEGEVGKLAGAYIGVVCSGLAGAAYGFPFFYYADDILYGKVAKVRDADEYEFHVGDVSAIKGHVGLITGFDFNKDNEITHITVNESASPNATERKISVSDFFKNWTTACKYQYISGFGEQEMEYPDVNDVKYNEYLCTDEGDKALVFKGHKFYIDVYSITDWNNLVIKNSSGTTIETIPVSNLTSKTVGDVTGYAYEVNTSNYSSGKYKAYLSGSTDSEPTEFEVCQSTESASYNSATGKITFTFSSDYGIPVGIEITDAYGNRKYGVCLDSKNRTSGTFTAEIESSVNTGYFRVYYKCEFGVSASPIKAYT